MNSTADETDGDDLYYAAVICTLALTGVITNGLSVYTVLRTKHLWNAFGYACVSHAAGGLGVLLVFGIYVTPLLLTPPGSVSGWLQNPRVDYTIGQLTIMFYYGSTYTHILIASNRFIVICKPLSYSRYFSKGMTMRWIALVWSIAFVQSCIYQINGCHYFFDRYSYSFTYSNSACGVFISSYMEFYINLAFVFFVLVADSLTVIKLKISSKGFKSLGTSISLCAQNKRKSLEIRFFIQSVCSEVALVLCFSCFWGFVRLARTKWAFFLLTTGAWQALHALDGIILVAFNRSIRGVCCPSKKPNTSLTTRTPLARRDVASTERVAFHGSSFSRSTLSNANNASTLCPRPDLRSESRLCCTAYV